MLDSSGTILINEKFSNQNINQISREFLEEVFGNPDFQEGFGTLQNLWSVYLLPLFENIQRYLPLRLTVVQNTILAVHNSKK